MEGRIENKSKSKILSKDKNEILFNMKSILNFINSKDDITYNYMQFNESLFINHTKWLDDIRKEIKESIKRSEPNINISDMIYENSLLSLLQRIARPNNYHNNNNNINENMNNNEIFEKIDELTNLENLNDMFGIINKCSKYKRDSLYKNEKNENVLNINNKDDLLDENFEIEYNDKDINMDQFNNDKKNNFDVMNNQIGNEENGNSLCTIVEIPSVEEREKNSKASKINKLSSNQLSLSNKNNNINNENNKNINNVLIEKKNNNNINICDINKNLNDINFFKPLNIIETNVKSHKYNDYSINKINIGDKNNITTNKNYNNKININIPFFTEIKKKDYNPDKNAISSNDTTPTFHKSNNLISNQKSSDKKKLILSKLDKNINPTQKIELSSLKNKSNVIIIQTSRKKEQIQKNENENSSNDKKNNNIDLFHKNYVQKIVLSSSKKAMNDMKNNKKEKEKYEDNFEEYEISDSSLYAEDEEEDKDKNKFVPKWAKDEEYINEKIKKQNNDNDLVKKSFGKFVIENLNLNMILETHIKDFDIRNSTADWRGEDDSLEKNKVTNIKNKEIDDMFPNRKLQF